MNLIRAAAACQITPLSLKYLYKNSKNMTPKKLISMSAFLQRELSNRLAHRVVELYKLPYGLPNNRNTQKVIRLYDESFHTIRDIPEIDTIEKSHDFSNIISEIKKNHTYLECDIGKAIQEIPKNYIIDHTMLRNQLDSFFISRIGIRALIGNCVALHDTKKDSVIENCNVRHILEDAKEDASNMCSLVYNQKPNIIIHGNNPLEIPYIKGHLHFVFFELLKNSLEATVIDAIKKNKEKPYLQPIYVNYSSGKNDLTLKIADKGGGFPRSKLEELFCYSYTSNKVTTVYDNTKRPIMSGFGFGLPLSRLYCNYFQGDLQLIPYEGTGTDAIVYINKLDKVKERLL